MPHLSEGNDSLKYKSAYYEGGYPPEEEGVCTDLVWRAFENAGYSLKDMVDEDIKNNIDDYPRVEGKADPNIDFRRVPNLKVYFEKYCTSYYLNPEDIEQWQPGDIVIFSDSHIGIIYDKRNSKGIGYVIHNGGQPVREEDALVILDMVIGIYGHYRFEAKEEN